MALSCYSNWNFPQPENDLQLELLGFQDGFFLDENPSIDPIFDNDYNNHTKHIKIHKDNDNKNNNCYTYTDFELPTLFDEPVDLYPTVIPECLPPLNFCQDFDFSFPVFSPGIKESIDSKTIVSTQSRAARQRRKRITDKTQELGKLIPGSNKMNTAEMFGAAYNYIQFLQAQVGVLQIMNTVLRNEDDLQTQVLQQLLSSSHVQHKLYSSEKCLVPKQLLHDLKGNGHTLINSSSTLSKELQNLISNSG